MLIKHIKESIKQKHSNNGDKSLRNNYQIITTNKDRTRWANRKYKLYLRDNLNGGGIDESLKKVIKKQWIKQGGTVKQLHQVGYKKAISILKAV